MVFDKIENYKLYASLSGRIAQAFEYIHATDFSKTAPGKYVIVHDEIFALVQEYDTKDMGECKLERHLKYIDIQYVISGEEQMGIASFKNQIPVLENKVDDYYYFNVDSTLITVGAGMFTIFFPDDLHMPCIKANQTSKVKKVVVKVRV